MTMMTRIERAFPSATLFLAALLAVACQSSETAGPPESSAPARVAEAAPGGGSSARAIEASAPAPARGTGASEPGTHRPGFYTREVDGRLWVFRTDDMRLYWFLESGSSGPGEPAESVTLVGAGPGGRTLRGPDRDTLLAYLASKPGFQVEVLDGGVWVFRRDGADLERFRAGEELAAEVIFVGAGPLGATLRAAEREVLEDYLAL